MSPSSPNCISILAVALTTSICAAEDITCSTIVKSWKETAITGVVCDVLYEETVRGRLPQKVIDTLGIVNPRDETTKKADYEFLWRKDVGMRLTARDGTENFGVLSDLTTRIGHSALLERERRTSSSASVPLTEIRPNIAW